jgi:RHS repeat-associated protein
MVAAACASSAQISIPASGIINTVAGAGSFTGDGGPATSARINNDAGVALDSSGNIYIADTWNNCVRKVTVSTGVITTIAGDDAGGYAGDGGAATTARLEQPQGVALDSSGNVYIADTGNNRIRKVTVLTGDIATIAGNGTAGYSGDGGAAISAELNFPSGVAVDSSGNVYIADAYNQRVRKLTVSTAKISTIAGNGIPGYTGNSGPAISAELSNPSGVAVDSSGNIYIADSGNNSVRKVTASSGDIAAFAGNGTYGYSGDNGPAVNAQLALPYGVFVDSSGNVYIADSNNSVIRKVTALTLAITTVAGNGSPGYLGDGAQAMSAALYDPAGVVVDASGNIYIADDFNCRVRKVTASTGIINTVAGSTSYGGDGGPATSALFYYPGGMRVDASGNLYIADTINDAIRKVTASTGIITTIAGNGTCCYSGDGKAATSAQLYYPSDVALDSNGNIYIADSDNSRIRKVTVATGVITTVAGNGTFGYSGDGSAAANAALNFPSGVAVDSAGNLYIADNDNNVIRKVTAAGIISTIAGDGVAGYTGDGGAALKATLDAPYFVALDGAGNLYISDSGNDVIREVLAGSGLIKTVVGTGVAGYSGDGGAAASAMLNFPQGIALDYGGNLYIADNGNSRVRKVRLSTTGVITTVAGIATPGYYGDTMAALSAELFEPIGVAVDASANLYVVDTNNDRVRAIGKEIPTVAPVVTWPVPATIGYGTALSATQLDATASVGGTFTYTPAAGQILPLGSNTLSVLFTPTDGVDYTTATATTTISVIQGVPKITWANPAAITAGTPLSATQLDATASTAGTFIYSPPAGTVLAQGTQTLTVDFTPSNTSEYASATASVSLTVNASTTAGIIHTIAGDGTAGYNGDSIAATSAELNTPYDSVADGAGNVYISDNANYRIRKVAAGTGIITTYAGNGVSGSSSCNGGYCTQGVAGNGGPATAIELGYVAGLAVDTSGNLYYADGDLCVIREITASNGNINTVAGNGYQGEYSGDGGAATSATLNGPLGVAVDTAGNLYISDSSNDVIRKVTASTKKISTIAGTGMVAGYSGDGGAAIDAKLNYPTGIAVDGSENVYVSDESNNVIRKVTATGNITTYAGDGILGYSGDNGPATGAELSDPGGISVDSAGDLFIADSSNSRVREVFAGTQVIATVAGTGTYGYNGDGIPATTAELEFPVSARVAANGNLYIADFGNNRVRMVGATTQAPNLTWLTPAPIYYGTALSATQLDATSNGVPGTITYSEAVGTVLKPGTYTLSAEFVPTSPTYSTETAEVTLTVNPAPAPVSWPQPADIANGTALSATQLDATSTLPGTFVYSPASGTVLGLGPHLLDVTFTPTDTIDYVPTTATVAITVKPGTTTYDAGTVAFVANTTTVTTVSYGQSSTAASVASALASAVNGVSSTPVTLIAVDNDLYLTAVTPGTAGDSITYAIENISYNTTFSGPSFPSSTLSGNLEGGAASGTDAGMLVYSYNDSYDHVGNMTASNDPLVMGVWSFTPDTLNRMAGATNVPVAGSTTSYYCWSYDGFGNRSLQGISSEAFASPAPACTPQSSASYQGVWAHLVTGNNRLSSTQQDTSGVSYDAAGNILNDGVNQYLYDGDGRICAVSSGSTGEPVLTGYIYNAEGERVAKGGITAWSCDPTVNGFKPMSDYIVGRSGEQMTEMDINASGTMAWQHTNVYALGQLIATYGNDGLHDGLHFYLNDPLGTRRAQTDYAGVLEETCSSLPFGDALSCTNNLQFPTEHHFTGKERDTESGNDYFGARYYASSMGRWMSPDPLQWIGWQNPAEDASEEAKEEAHQKFENWISNPQNFNMYAYVNNNPLNHTDPTGMAGCTAGDKTFTTCTITITYDPKTSQGTLVVTGQNKGDKDPTVLLTSSVVVGGDGHVTPTGTFTAKSWEKDQLNSNYAGATGTWASSNPLVMYVSQTGLAWAITSGTANITYTSPTGVKFSEWTMYVN